MVLNLSDRQKARRLESIRERTDDLTAVGAIMASCVDEMSRGSVSRAYRVESSRATRRVLLGNFGETVRGQCVITRIIRNLRMALHLQFAKASPLGKILVWSTCLKTRLLLTTPSPLAEIGLYSMSARTKSILSVLLRSALS
jgi:hypothetical protein